MLGIASPAPKSNVSMHPQPKRPSKKCRPHSCQYVAGPHLYGIGLHSAEKEATQKRTSVQPSPYPDKVTNAVKSFTNVLRF